MRRAGMSPFKAGLITLVIAAVVTYFGFTKAVPFVHHFQIKAVFQTANNIKPGSPVRIAGVNIGKVTDVQHLRPGKERVVVTMRIDDKGQPIHTDAFMKIRPRIFLEGNFFVDLRPGTPQAPILGDGGTIPVAQTATPVQFDQVLGTLQRDTRQDLVTLLANYATALQGPGAQGYNRSIRYQAPAYRNATIANEATLGLRPHDLSGYINGSGSVAAALDRDPARLKSLIVDFNTTAAAFARQEGSLRQTVAELPRTLRAAQPAFAALDAAFPHVRRLVVDFRPAVRTSGPTIDATRPFLRQLRGLVSPAELRGLVADLRPTIPSLARLNVETVPLLRQTRLASSCQNNVILPWSHNTIQDPTFASHGPVYQEGVKFLPGLAGESRSGDANGQWFHVLGSGGFQAVPLGNGMVTQQLFPTLGTRPPKPAKGDQPNGFSGTQPVRTRPGRSNSRFGRPPLAPNVPCETQQPPDLRTVRGAVQQPAPAKRQGAAALSPRDRTAAVRELSRLVDRRQLGAVLRAARLGGSPR